MIDFRGNIENLRRSTWDDSLSGSDGANLLIGHPTDASGGRTAIRAGGSDDAIYGIGNDAAL